uniref:RING-CH-type domain-containing protein n=1 Tax=Elaeophora elaphi TaxID=1147741 RepID=A0A0R3S1H9_9BILA
MKVCRYCLSDDDISEWLAPCKCIGTMKWVHLSCFEQWLAFAPYTMKYSCAICNYVYRRQWRLKPYKDWHWPQFHLRVTDLFGIYFDITLTYRICRYFPRCLDNRFSIDDCFKEVVMRFESMKNGKWEVCDSFNDGSNGENQVSRTNLKICRFCYVEGSGEIDWLRPCKCSGSMLWVHKQCFNSWLGKASGKSRIQCQICRFMYRKMLLIKPWKEWCLPNMHLSFIDVLELLFDAFILYRMKFAHTVNRPSSVVVRILRTSYIFHRFGFYARAFSTVASSFFSVVIIDAM